MNCQQCQDELEDFLYGEAGAGVAAEMRAHFADCETCRGSLEKLEREARVFSDYYTQTAMEPSSELWDAIRDRIRDEAPAVSANSWAGWLKGRTAGFSLSWLLRPAMVRQLAAALALIVVTVVVTTFLLSRRPGNDQLATRETQTTPTPVTTPEPGPVRNSGSDLTLGEPSGGGSRLVNRPIIVKPEILSEEAMLKQQIARTEREYLRAIRMLDQAIVKRKLTLDPSAFAQFESSLALIDDSIEKSRLALRGEKKDAAAGQFLLAAYARKVELMQEIAIQ